MATEFGFTHDSDRLAKMARATARSVDGDGGMLAARIN